MDAGRRRASEAQELARLRRYGLIIVNEVDYLPFERNAANLFSNSSAAATSTPR